jgi:TolA-binding protein
MISKLKLSPWLGAILLLSVAGPASRAFGDVPVVLEAEYSQALVSYYQKNYDAAAQKLTRLLKRAPKEMKILELKALVDMAKEDFASAAQTYSALVTQAAELERSETVLAPYRFGAAMAALRLGQTAEAEDGFKKVLAAQYNLAACHYFLGGLRWRRGDLPGARAQFNEITRVGDPEFLSGAYYYLGLIDAKEGSVDKANADFQKSKETAALASAAKPAIDGNLGTRSLASLDSGADRGQWRGQLGLATGYDSNLLTTPVAAYGSGTGVSSAKEVISAGVTYATSPNRTWQFVPSYDGSFNYNFKQTLKTEQYISNRVALYLTHGPQEPFLWGVKAEGNAIFQYGAGGGFIAYNYSGAFGPYARRELGRSWILGGEVFLEPNRFQSDPDLSEYLRRSGLEQSARVYLSKDVRASYFNPQVSLIERVGNSTGAEFRYKSLGLDLEDRMYFGKWIFSLGGSATFAFYDSRPTGSRNDSILGAEGAVGRSFGALALELRAKYVANISNVGDYDYRRLVALVSGNYLFR